ncbi:hypothetical protein [Bradyrhizobium centrosematis]|uniref:hypothetical protein n=1 Tax=Bradyrhizobium centrosematis TaxID=1300039 RepID=UPI00216770B6|nr:hypothetical protein [Bradyrhizobium centrosematis]MCS3763179.1 hypothetical protein [Bradyrhizobium centrosematis]MCS3775846.1 hypothetical protein [Bradyrhizobium centrosematis]
MDTEEIKPSSTSSTALWTPHAALKIRQLEIAAQFVFSWLFLGGIMEQHEVEAAVQESFPRDIIHSSYGPSQLAQSVVWEVWVKDKGKEFANRFVEVFEDGTHKTYGSFQILAVKLNKQHLTTVDKAKEDEFARQAKAAAQAAALSNSRIELFVKLGVMIALVAVGLGVAVFLAMSGVGLVATAAVSALLPIIGAACLWAFGRYPRFKWPDLPDAGPSRDSPQQAPGTSI